MNLVPVASVHPVSIMDRVFQNAPCEIYSFCPETFLFTNANERALKNLQYGLSELKIRTPIDIKPDISKSKFQKLVSPLVAGTQSVLEFETRHRRKDGTTYVAKVSLELIQDKVPQFLALILDISGEKEAMGLASKAQFQLQSSIEVLPDAFVLYDRSDRLVLCNEKYRQFYARSAPAMVPGALFIDILRYGLDRGEYPDAVGRERAWLAERLRAHRRANSTVEQELSDGRRLRIIERRTPEGGRVGLRVDITELVQSSMRAVQAEQRLSDAIDALPAAFWLFDKDDRLILQNESNRNLLSPNATSSSENTTYSEIERHEVLNGQYVDALGREQEWLNKRIAERNNDSYELEYKRADGRWIRSLNQRTSEGGHVGFRIDITEAKERQFELEQLASNDPLTGLTNRRGISSFLADVATRLRSTERVFFLHVDLDKFKAVNDTIGHDAGDFVLRHVASVLSSHTRAEDLVARVGGDEFLISLVSKMNDDEIVGFADRLRCSVSEPANFTGRVCHVGASIGISAWSPCARTSVNQAMADADIALNSAKASGRNRTTLFKNQMREVTVKMALEAQEIAKGLEKGEFVAFFQPQLDISGRRIIGFESLARWLHPERGTIAAGSFISAAEDAGLLRRIDQIVMQHALLFSRQLSDIGLGDIRVSVNISVDELNDTNIVQRFLTDVEAHKLKPEQIGIEVLEATFLDVRSSQAVKSVREFAEAGFSIDLDDFGTGHTAISSLRNLPVKRIKIDRSLISRVDQDGELHMITDAVVGLGRKLGMSVLAEGIETEGELMAVEKMGCTCVQGYLFAQAMQADAAIEWAKQSTVLTLSA